MEIPTAETALGTRERIVQATAQLLERRGYEGAGIKQIAGAAHASLGSVYHFFPGGKAELAAEAIRVADREFAELLRTALAGQRDPGKAVAACTRAVAAALKASDWTGGCTFIATAVETSDSAPQVHQAIAEAVERWEGVIADKLRDGGLRAADARDLARTVNATLAGAALASQIARDDRPLRIAGRHLARLVGSYRHARA